MDDGSDLKNTLKKDGYSEEEKYFYELNRRLIDELKKQKKTNESKSL